jgi:hypothetical protein
VVPGHCRKLAANPHPGLVSNHLSTLRQKLSFLSFFVDRTFAPLFPEFYQGVAGSWHLTSTPGMCRIECRLFSICKRPGRSRWQSLIAILLTAFWIILDAFMVGKADNRLQALPSAALIALSRDAELCIWVSLEIDLIFGVLHFSCFCHSAEPRLTVRNDPT